jgi:hypothetical protein
MTPLQSRFRSLATAKNTFCETWKAELLSELKRILEEKDSKNTRRATKSAVKIFGSYLKARNIPENFEQLTNEELDEEILRRSTSRERGTLSKN